MWCLSPGSGNEKGITAKGGWYLAVGPPYLLVLLLALLIPCTTVLSMGEQLVPMVFGRQLMVPLRPEDLANNSVWC